MNQTAAIFDKQWVYKGLAIADILYPNKTQENESLIISLEPEPIINKIEAPLNFHYIFTFSKK